MSNVCVVIPTLNEAGTIEALIEGVEKHRAQDSMRIVVVDDGSTDGTLESLERLAEEHGNITVIERGRKLGFGSAIRDGLEAALRSDAPPNAIVTMDADLSHDPEQLPSLTGACDPDTLVIGSRYVEGGAIRGWGPYRTLVSGGANLLARVFTDIPTRDCTSGYRCYGAELVKAVLPGLESTGYDIQIEVLEESVRRGFRVVEVPIKFVDRDTGESKLDRGQMLVFLRRLAAIFVRSGEWGRMVKFVAVGLSGVVVNEAAIWALTEHLGVHYLLSGLLSAEAAVVNNFYWNEIWTFRDDRNGGRVLDRAVRFHISRVGSLILGFMILAFLTEFLGVYYLVSNMVSIVLVMAVNYVTSRGWVWT